MTEPMVHRYIPNSAPGVREAMLQEIGIESVDEIYKEIPEGLRYSGTIDIPQKPASELEVARRVRELLHKNRATNGLLSFLGAGCWPHYVPAVCDEISGRSEFLTAYAGDSHTDLGRFQAIFEYQSMLGDLLEMDVVSAPVYDGATACGDAVHMASPERMGTIRNYSEPWLKIRQVGYHPDTGQMDLDDLMRKISDRTAAVLLENPGYLGFIESQCAEIGDIAHAHGALLIAFVNPASLGILAPPGAFGADIACGEGQPLGVHMQGGAGLGILAAADQERFLPLMPSFVVGMSGTTVDGERSFAADTVHERLVYSARYRARSFTGSSSWLWGIAAATYMALMGPSGMRQLGEVNMRKAHYAISRLSMITALKVPAFRSTSFNEFVVNFDKTGKSVQEVNSALFKRGILGGKDLSRDLPELGQSALYCVTETHLKDDIDRLARELAEVI
jgi:glycine dehydrogenase subunit 1